LSTHQKASHLQAAGIQVRLSDHKGNETSRHVNIVRRETAGVMQKFLFVKDSLRVLGNEVVMQWLDLPHVPDGRYLGYGGEDPIMTWQDE
jgi:hypothetical protein